MQGFSSGFKNSLFIFCVVFLTNKGAHGKCVPGKVASVNFTADYKLTWPAALNPNNCTFSNYVIYLTDLNEGSLQLYQTSTAENGTNAYNFSTLEMCTSYSFSVMAKTDDNVLGEEEKKVFTTPPKANVSLNITIDHTISSDNSINIQWEMAETDVSKCVSYYRLVVWNDTNEPSDFYLETPNYTLPNVIPCATYEFQVRAIVVNPEIEGPFSLVKQASAPSPTDPPQLQSIATTDTTATMVWQLEPYASNTCQIKDVVIETVLRPTVTIPIIDEPSRTPVTVRLTGLTEDTVYSSNVFVMNSAGNSSKVTITYQTANNVTVLDQLL